MKSQLLSETLRSKLRQKEINGIDRIEIADDAKSMTVWMIQPVADMAEIQGLEFALRDTRVAGKVGLRPLELVGGSIKVGFESRLAASEYRLDLHGFWGTRDRPRPLAPAYSTLVFSLAPASQKYFCDDQQRRNRVAAIQNPPINGIDFVEVSVDQRSLVVHLIKPVPGNTVLDPTIVQIRGGERIMDIEVTSISLDPPNEDTNRLVVQVDRPGDFSTYTLQLRRSFGDVLLDPLLSAVDFSFKVDCPSNLECHVERSCPPTELPEPEIDYLAKDYASFRRLILDRLSVVTPQWTERSAADLGIALVELIAYVGDYLSYRQDAVATEAYLSTACSRISVRRHARLVDYPMHNGCNARVWIQFEVEDESLEIKRGTAVFSSVDGFPTVVSDDQVQLLLSRGTEGFETLEDQLLFATHNRMSFHTWGEGQCCLPQGATRATLKGGFPNLVPGDVLILMETRDPLTGNQTDRATEKRHAVRLTAVSVRSDPIGDFDPNQPDTANAVDVTEIHWGEDDALPFALTVSNEQGMETAAALGNVVIADHGHWVREEHLGPATARFRPKLAQTPVTFAHAYDARQSASSAIRQQPTQALPVVALLEAEKGEDNNLGTEWSPVHDLLRSGPEDRHFVAEIEHDGSARLRFGDGRYGQRPAVRELPPAPASSASDKQLTFTARYRVGNGSRGNLGAGAIGHVVHNQKGIKRVWNPMPARGGIQSESVAQVRRFAPHAFREQLRAVKVEDYANMAKRHPEVQNAIASKRWTGSWHTIFITIDRRGGLPIDQEFEDELRVLLDRYRMAGHDVEIEPPTFVPLAIEMTVTVRPHVPVMTARRELITRLGARGLFHPDHFTFGQTVFLSPIYEAAHSVDGVQSVIVDVFRRLRRDDAGLALQEGKISLHATEIAQLDNDRNFPERGYLKLKIRGGR